MRRGHVDFSSAPLFDQFRGTADRARRTDHVVKHQRHLAVHRTADQVFLLRLASRCCDVCRRSPDCRPVVSNVPIARLMLPSSGLTTTISSSCQTLVQEVSIQHGSRVQVVDRHVKEPLNLGGVQVHGQRPVRSGPGDQVRHELRRDRHASFVLAILPGVPEIGQDRGHPRGAGPLATVDHDQQFHQVLVHGRTGRLHQIDVAAADVLLDLAGDLAVRKIAEDDRDPAADSETGRFSATIRGWPDR